MHQHSEISCSKVAFNSEREATKALKRAQKDKRRKKKPVRVYKCGYCDKWHMTSKTKNEFHANLMGGIRSDKAPKKPVSMKRLLRRKKYLEKKINK